MIKLITVILALIAIVFILSFMWFCVNPIVCIVGIIYCVYVWFNPPKSKLPKGFKLNGDDIYMTKQAEHIKNVTFKK